LHKDENLIQIVLISLCVKYPGGEGRKAEGAAPPAQFIA